MMYFLCFKCMIEKQLSVFIKCIQTSGVAEFKPLIRAIDMDSVIHRCTYPHTSTQNRVIEYRHRHTVKKGLTLLYQSQVLLQFWVYAFNTTIFLINRFSSKVLGGKSPYEILYSKEFDMSNHGWAWHF